MMNGSMDSMMGGMMGFGWLPMLSRVLASARLIPEAHGGAGLVYALVRRADVGDLRSEEVESVIL